MQPAEDAQDVASPCRAREVFERVGDKWSISVIHLLGARTMRFTDLRLAVDGVSQRMLTVTLRGLERDGIVTRTVHPIIPPRVEYALTRMGRTLLSTVGSLVAWADAHLGEIGAARAAYDRRVVEAAMTSTDTDCAELREPEVSASEPREDHVGH